jgi:hypothetical protein
MRNGMAYHFKHAATHNRSDSDFGSDEGDLQRGGVRRRLGAVQPHRLSLGLGRRASRPAEWSACANPTGCDR